MELKFVSVFVYKMKYSFKDILPSATARFNRTFMELKLNTYYYG